MRLRSDKRGSVRVLLRVGLDDEKVFRVGDMVKVVDVFRWVERVGTITKVNFSGFELECDEGPLWLRCSWVDSIEEVDGCGLKL